MTRCTAICLFFVLLFSACGNRKTETSSTQQPLHSPAPAIQDYTGATEKMARIIARAFAGIDPAKATFLVGDRRLEFFQQQGNVPDPGARLNAWIYYANELLNTGDTEQAVVEFETILKEIAKIQVDGRTMLFIRRMLAVSYLRMGEEANCLSSHNHASCIIPIAPEAQYKMTKGSETAMQLCLAILKDFPGDEETVWLLNLAAMTIGKYPGGIPEQWRIPESAFISDSKFPRFKDVSHKVGISGANLAGGVCIEDFDDDGWLDILTSSWGPDDPLTLWKNTGDGKFVNASAGMGLKGINGGLNIVYADINNDGLPDVFVTRGAWLRDQGKIPNSMLLNQGNGRFVDITQHAGMLTYAPTQTAAFADFNLDGWIDLFVGNESGSGFSFPNELYLNNRNNTFRNVINDIGVNTQGFIKGCVAGDVNNDGWPDLYISTFPGKNMLLLNKGTNADDIPQFENVAFSAGVQGPEYSFPTWMWDFNNDGWQDIFVSGYGNDNGELTTARDFVRNAQGESLNTHPRLYQNSGNGTFEDVTEKVGLTESIYTMGCNYGDIDGDGYLDFYLGTGAPEYSSVVPNKMFRNHQGISFDDITSAGGFGHIQKGHALGFGDLDRDGDLDIFQSLGGAFEGDRYEDVLFENPVGAGNKWTVLLLEGVRSNRMAIGAALKITLDTPSGERYLHRRVSTGGSFGSSSIQQEIGLANAKAIKEVEIMWPDSAHTKQVFHDIPVNTYVRITEGAQTWEEIPVDPARF